MRSIRRFIGPYLIAGSQVADQASHRVVYIRFIGTHRHYDNIDAMDITRSSPRDHRRALTEIEGLMDAKRGTPEGDRLTC